MLLKYIYFCLYINLKYLVTHDHIHLIQHIDALHAYCSDDLSSKCLYADCRIFILFADIVKSFHVFIKIFSRMKIFTLQYIFKIYNHVFNALNDAQIMLARKTHILWAWKLIAAIKTTRSKLQYYYSRT